MQEVSATLQAVPFDENKKPELRKTVLSQWYVVECYNCGGIINLLTADYCDGFKVCPDCGMLN
jgi:hypothetical protein